MTIFRRHASYGQAGGASGLSKRLSKLRQWHQDIAGSFSGIDLYFQYGFAFAIGFAAPLVTFLAGRRSLTIPVIAIFLLIIMRLLMRPPYRARLLLVWKTPAGMVLTLLLGYITLHGVLLATGADIGQNPLRILGKPLFIALALSVLFYVRATPEEPYNKIIKYMLLWGAAVFVVLFTLECIKNITILELVGWYSNKLQNYFTIPILQMNRALEVFSALVFPVALALRSVNLHWLVHALVLWTFFISFVNYGGLVLIIRHLDSESVQVGLMASYFIYLLSRRYPTFATHGLFMGMLICFASAPWLFQALYTAFEHLAIDLPATLSRRLEIWDEVAKLTLNSPLFGAGIDHARFFAKELSSKPFAHPHNMFLQVWFDLGFVGFLLVAAFIALIWRAVSRLNKQLVPEINATITMLALLVLTTHSLWQSWFLSLILITSLLTMILSRQQDQTSTP